MTLYEKIIDAFCVPREGRDILDVMLTKMEQEMLCSWPEAESLSEEALAGLLCDKGMTSDKADALNFIEKVFCRGVLNKSEDGYCRGSFYGRLDIFATDEASEYRKLPKEKRDELDDWYFAAYLRGLKSSGEARPTADEVLPLEDTLEFIDKKEEQPYLALCDCRMLKGACDKPVLTCITYRTAPNSFVKRGLAKKITKQEAMQVVKDADKAGLMHTVNPGGVCSCCTDCCYLFRAARALDSRGTWPRVHYRAVLDEDKCIGCRSCMRRCHFNVFDLKKDKAKENDGKRLPVQMVSPDSCVGCGLCVTGCPADALTLEGVITDEYSSRIHTCQQTF